MEEKAGRAPQPRLQKVPAAKVQFLAEDRAWIADRIQEVLASGQLTLGKYGAEFEQKFASGCGVRHGIAVSSGTSALEIILRGLGVAGKDVLVPTNTFFATCAAVVHAGGRPIFVDIEPESFAIDGADAERCLTADTVGVIAVHVGGIISGSMPALADFAAKKGLWLIEDAAHAHGSSLNGTSAGAFGVAAGFSFYPTKVMTSAEGGMIVTNDPRLAEEARIYRDQGKASFTQNAHVRLGYNWRMSEPHAIIGLRHLSRLPDMIAERQAIAELYDEGLRGIAGLQTLPIPAGAVCNYYKYIAILKRKRDRKELKTILREKYGVSLAGEVYEEPLHRQPVFASYATRPLPMAEDLCARHICLPVFSGMLQHEAQQVINALKEVIA